MGIITGVYTDEFGEVVESLKGLSGKLYVFYWCESLGIVLDSYLELSRKTTRHKFQPDCRWDRLSNRYGQCDKPDAVPNVVTAARQQIRDKVDFKGGW